MSFYVVNECICFRANSLNICISLYPLSFSPIAFDNPIYNIVLINCICAIEPCNLSFYSITNPERLFSSSYKIFWRNVLTSACDLYSSFLVISSCPFKYSISCKYCCFYFCMFNVLITMSFCCVFDYFWLDFYKIYD